MADLPTNPYAKKGEIEPGLVALKGIAQPLQDAARDLATLMEKHRFDEGIITIRGEENVAGEVRLQRPPHGEGLSVSVTGRLGEGLSPYRGTPYTASYTGAFYWRPTPDSPDFVVNGQYVRQDEPVGWATGESKDMQYAIRADTAGIIQLVAPHGSPVVEGETVLFYIEGTS